MAPTNGVDMKPFSRRQFLTMMAGASLVAGCGSSFEETITLTPSPITSFDASIVAQLEAALDEVYRTSETPGLIVGAWVGARGWTGIRGTTTLGGESPASRDLFSRIASVTKTMTGTIVLQLIDEGLLSFDDTLDQWFPDIEGASEITIRHLGSMASGLESYTESDAIINEFLDDPERDWEPLDLLYAGAALPRRFDPGQGFYYCNTNLVALGLIVERILDQPLSELMQERLFVPLGMRNTSYPSTAAIPDPHWSGYTLQGATGDEPLDSTSWSPTFAAGAGQVISRLDDLAIWARALGRGSTLSPATLAQRLVPNPFTSEPRLYAFAVGINNGWIAHSGTLPGFTSQVAYLPSLDAVIVTLANSDIRDQENLLPAPKAFSALTRVLTPNNVS